jgi:tetratricopeptide (TPR) repeat protein
MKAVEVCEKAGATTRHGVLLSNAGDQHCILREYEEASKCYKEVGRLGEKDGNFELYSMSQLGLSGVARKTGRKEEAMELARETLEAAGLMAEGDHRKSRLCANAILGIIRCSDLNDVEFDAESLLDRLVVLGEEVDLDPREGGGSTIGVQALALIYTRNLSMGRISEAVENCRELISLAAQVRFEKVSFVQTASQEAKSVLDTLGVPL